MQISRNDWIEYINKLSKINILSAREMRNWVNTNGLGDRDALINYAKVLVDKYGEASAELACQMLDAILDFEIATDIDGVINFVPSEVATYGEVGKAINGSLKKSPSGQLIDSTVARLVKQANADTMLENCKKYGGEFAWIPFGDTCPFCLTLSSRGWQNVSKETLKKGHAEHIHANCDCNYAVRFDRTANVEGYDPQEYLDMYYSHDGSPKEKINAMRREQYQLNKEKILAQKKEAYKKRKSDI